MNSYLRTILCNFQTLTRACSELEKETMKRIRDLEDKEIKGKALVSAVAQRISNIKTLNFVPQGEALDAWISAIMMSATLADCVAKQNAIFQSK